MSVHRHRLIERRESTQTARTDDGRVSSGIADEILAEQTERLALFSAVGAGLWTFGLLLDHLTSFTATPIPHEYDVRLAWIIELIGIGNSLVMLTSPTVAV